MTLPIVCADFRRELVSAQSIYLPFVVCLHASKQFSLWLPYVCVFAKQRLVSSVALRVRNNSRPRLLARSFARLLALPMTTTIIGDHRCGRARNANGLGYGFGRSGQQSP